jgi:D-tyrosyl-tRNA(Tyr) deacylase
MKAVVQRVTQSTVTVDRQIVGKIGRGLVVLLGVDRRDTQKEVEYLAEKIVHLRIFEDQDGRLNRCLLDMGGSMLVVSQFTLLGDCRKGRRPSFLEAAAPEQAEALYAHFVRKVEQMGVTTATGRFRTTMEVSLTNYGPVTLVLEAPP